MAFWLLLSFMIQLLLGLGRSQNHNETDSNKTLVSSEYLTLEYSLEFQSLENVIGATFHNNYLLVYSENILTILDLSQNTTQKPAYKYLSGFQPKKLVTGFNSSQLLLITQGQHCIRELEFETRQISTFSGKCDEAGFVDGEADIVRYNIPSDLARSGDHFFIADYNNDCIRRMWHDGYVRMLLSIHSKPFALSANLYVAARQQVYEVRESRNTYVRFVADINVTSLESCSCDVLSMLTMNKCLMLHPLSRDVSTFPLTINSSFSGLMCRNGVTFASKLIPHDGNFVTMQLSSVDVRSAVGLGPTTTSEPLPSAATTTTPLTTSTPLSSTPSSTSPPTTTTASSTPTTGPPTLSSKGDMTNMTYMENHPSNASKLVVTTKLDEIIYTEPTKSSTNFVQNGSSSTPVAIVPLHNHAHEPFSHLPESYTEHNGDWNVVLPVALAVVTVIVVLVVFACILYKRSKNKKRRLSEDDSEELCDYGELTENLISDNNGTSSCSSDSDYRSSSPDSRHLVPPNIRVVDIVTKDEPSLRNGNGFLPNRNTNGIKAGHDRYSKCNGRANGKILSYSEGIVLPQPNTIELHQSV